MNEFVWGSREMMREMSAIFSNISYTSDWCDTVEADFVAHALRYSLFLIMSDGEIADAEMSALNVLFDLELSGTPGRRAIIDHLNKVDMVNLVHGIPLYMLPLIESGEYAGRVAAFSVIVLENIALSILAADGHLDEREISAAMMHIKVLRNYLAASGIDWRVGTSVLDGLKPTVEETESFESLSEQLGQLGLDPEVNTEIEKFVNLLRISHMRKSHGLTPVPFQRHIVLKGAQEDSQNRLAHLLHKFLACTGFVDTSRVLEFDYPNVIDLRGRSGGVHEFDREVLITNRPRTVILRNVCALPDNEPAKAQAEFLAQSLLTLLSNHTECTLILTGSSEGIDELISLAPLGPLNERTVLFAEPSTSKLALLFLRFTQTAGYQLSDDAYELLNENVERLIEGETGVSTEQKIKLLFDKVITQHAVRLGKLEHFTPEVLSTIEFSDLVSALSN